LLSGLPANLLVRADYRTDPEISDLACDSRRVVPGTLFFAVKGMRTDGHLFLDRALERGAVAVVSEEAPRASTPVAWVQVTSVRRWMPLAADRFFDYPSRKLRLIGITGTNGKTTTAYLVHSILNTETKALMLGTIQTMVGDSVFPSRLTTPESIDIQAALSHGWDAGCRAGVLEVSSHALFLERAYGCRFPVAVFTNLTQDHLDFHSSFEDYFDAKKLLFDRHYNPGLEHSVINADDPWGSRLASQAPGVITFGLSPDRDVRVADYRTSVSGTTARIELGERQIELKSRLVGRHNVYNVLAATAACSALGISDAAIREGIRLLQVVPGRFEVLALDRPYSVVIDYAHTPDALENVLCLAREVTRGRLICLFGCGGDRDRTKRPLMGALAVRHADLILVTSDNPRTEDPDAIIQEILAGIPDGMPNVEVITDRRRAIRRALEVARDQDIVLLAGKGHETYQEIGTSRIAFDEREVVKEELCSA
jgi:UDP-N-acetylmuramoyl-L-alanyl-D-glutamate--2,6-diaminopimelate ligase